MSTIELLVAGLVVVAGMVGGVILIQTHAAALNRRDAERGLRDAKCQRLRRAFVDLVGAVLDQMAARRDAPSSPYRESYSRTATATMNVSTGSCRDAPPHRPRVRPDCNPSSYQYHRE